MNYALVENGVIVNVIALDDPDDFSPPTSHAVVPIEDGFWIGDGYEGGEFVHRLAEPAPITGEQIDAERERRIALPLTVALSVGAITINMDAYAQRNVQGIASVGQYLLSTGSTALTAFRDYDNISHDLTPSDLISMGLQVAQRIQVVYAKSWAIKAMDPIPQDYADDARW